MEISRITVTRRGGVGPVLPKGDDDDGRRVIPDGHRVTVRMLMRDGVKDAEPPDDRHKAYLDRNAYLQSAWQKNRAFRASRISELPWQQMPAGARKPRPGRARGDAAAVGDDDRVRHIDDERRETIADCEAIRSKAQSDYVTRIASAWKRRS